MIFEDTDILTRRIAFAMVRGQNLTTAQHMLELMNGDVSTFFEVSDDLLRRRFNIKSSIVDKAYRRSLIDDAFEELSFVKKNGIDTIFFNDSNYPLRLAQCSDGPAILYKLGNVNLDAKKVVAVVGTRHATAYGVDMATRLVSDLAQEYGSELLIVSGLAYGIDVAAHRAALANGVPTLAVAANPLNTIYPAEHRSVAVEMIKNNGGIITEYGVTQSVHKGNFLARNRIIAGLSDCTIVVESDRKGGAMSTARIAAAYDREVFAVPGRCSDRFSRGCNFLIASQGAQLVDSADTLIDVMRWPRKPKEGSQPSLTNLLSDDQLRVLRHLRDNPDHTVNEVVVNLGIPYPELSTILFELEMSDLIVSIPGARYAVTSLAADID